MTRLPMGHSAPVLELGLNNPVYCQDGVGGTLSHIRFHPCCGALSHLIIRRSLFASPRRVIVPSAYIDTLSPDHVALHLPRAALDTFPSDTPHLLRALGADWRMPNGESGVLPVSSPELSAHGPDCCTGTGRHAAIALLCKAQPVVCEDGRAGRLAMLLLDPQTLRVLQLVVYHGHVVRQTTTVPLTWVAGITPQHIRLKAQRHQLAELPPYHTDAEIADDVRYGLRMAPTFRPYAEWLAIAVTAHDGVVLLHGNVRSSAHRQEAERIAQQQLSVRHVCNELRTDDELSRQVVRAIGTHTRLRAAGVMVNVELGLVELTGEVDSSQQVALILATVQQVRGVRRVNNLLKVGSPVERVSRAAMRDSVIMQGWPRVTSRDEKHTGVLNDRP